MKTEETRTQLAGIAKIIAGLEEELRAARGDRAKLIKTAYASKEIPMSEAAKLAGISRVAAYDILKG